MISDPELLGRFFHGIELFNRRDFYDCHEVLEDVWNEQEDPDKQLTQGLIQVAVAYHHALSGNYAGAKKLFPRGITRIKPFLPCFMNLNLTEFLEAVESDMESLTNCVDPVQLKIPRIEMSS